MRGRPVQGNDGVMTAMTTTFQTFGASHWLMLGLFVAGIWPIVLLGRRNRGRDSRRFDRGFAIAICCFTVPMQLIDLTPHQFDFDTTLPLQLCDFAWLAVVAALWTRHRVLTALAYFWGLALTTQALVTPWLTADFPDPKFLGFWGMHYLIVWAAIYLAWGQRLVPRWRDYATTVAITFGWLISVFCFNLAFGTNYGFVNEKPSTGSVLDYLGPWPAYVVVEIAIVAAGWALMTWPWNRGRRDHPSTIAAC